jgi:hypothetical protein
VNTAGVVVVIRNLRIASVGTGINLQSGATLIVENCVIRNMSNFGIFFRPLGVGARLIVTNTLLANNGGGSSGAGLVIQPTGSGSADVVLDRVRVENNTTGVFAAAPPGTNGVRLVMRNSTVSANYFTGFAAVSQGPVVTSMIEASDISNNLGTGVLVQGAQAFVFVNRSTITSNDTGWTATGGGNLVTEGTNSVYLNRTSNGAPSASIGLQ